MISWFDITTFVLLFFLIIDVIISIIFFRLEGKKIREIAELLDERDRLLKKESEKKRTRISFKDFWKLN